ncbi:MAG: sugar ABC transporter substrate-binding protein [Kosmotogaceae bacterium]
MKRTLIVLLITVLITSISFAATPLIGVASQHLGNDWNRGVVKGLKDTLESMGYDFIHTNARGDTNQQVADIENFLARRVDAVIIAGGEGPAFESVMRKLANADIPVITIDIPSQYTLCNVTSDNFNAGEKLALYTVNKLEKEGEIVVFDTPGWYSLLVRARMLDTVIMDYPEVEIATRFECSVIDSVNNSYQQMRSYLLSNPNVDSVYCTWGLPAIGASKAIRELGLQDEIFVTCVDADQAVLQEMLKPDSPLTAVVGQYPEKLGQIAVEMTSFAINGEFDKIPVEAYAPIILIEKDAPEIWFSGLERMLPDQAWDALYTTQ